MIWVFTLHWLSTFDYIKKSVFVVPKRDLNRMKLISKEYEVVRWESLEVSHTCSTVSNESSTRRAGINICTYQIQSFCQEKAKCLVEKLSAQRSHSQESVLEHMVPKFTACLFIPKLQGSKKTDVLLRSESATSSGCRKGSSSQTRSLSFND